VILQEKFRITREFTRFVLLLPPEQAKFYRGADAKKISLAMRLAHKPGALLASLSPLRSMRDLLRLKAGRFTDGRGVSVLSGRGGRGAAHLEQALKETREATSVLRVLGKYAAARR